MTTEQAAVDDSVGSAPSLSGPGMSSVAERLRLHKEKVATRKQEAAISVRHAISSTHAASASLVADMNQHAAAIFARQVQIEEEAKELQDQVKEFSQVAVQWVSLFDKFNGALKELGDVHHWAGCLDSDVGAVLMNLKDIRRVKGLAP
eukprot:TRINITY_DN1214_c0_g1_i1.p4 TRINITY_DN1214_c0_g1~~TRINITY_DN1214_c0_g1_i1.p4  ORF type:complete len:167 (+),score=14.75 TRINITY_DN1214_c0_g1_i1:58-501(+)